MADSRLTSVTTDRGTVLQHRVSRDLPAVVRPWRPARGRAAHRACVVDAAATARSRLWSSAVTSRSRRPRRGRIPGGTRCVGCPLVGHGRRAARDGAVVRRRRPGPAPDGRPAVTLTPDLVVPPSW